MLNNEGLGVTTLCLEKSPKIDDYLLDPDCSLSSNIELSSSWGYTFGWFWTYWTVLSIFLVGVLKSFLTPSFLSGEFIIPNGDEVGCEVGAGWVIKLNIFAEFLLLPNIGFGLKLLMRPERSSFWTVGFFKNGFSWIVGGSYFFTSFLFISVVFLSACGYLGYLGYLNYWVGRVKIGVGIGCTYIFFVYSFDFYICGSGYFLSGTFASIYLFVLSETYFLPNSPKLKPPSFCPNSSIFPLPLWFPFAALAALPAAALATPIPKIDDEFCLLLLLLLLST